MVRNSVTVVPSTMHRLRLQILASTADLEDEQGAQ